MKRSTRHTSCRWPTISPHEISIAHPTERRHNGLKVLITRVRVDASNTYYAELPYDGLPKPADPKAGVPANAQPKR